MHFLYRMMYSYFDLMGSPQNLDLIMKSFALMWQLLLPFDYVHIN